MKNIIINIPDMLSAHCQSRVNHAVRGIEGVQIQHLEAGQLAASVASDSIKNEVEVAIKKAGYTVSSEEDSSASDCSTGCCSK